MKSDKERMIVSLAKEKESDLENVAIDLQKQARELRDKLDKDRKTKEQNARVWIE